jgi:methionyl-tRNA formyltransferase
MTLRWARRTLLRRPLRLAGKVLHRLRFGRLLAGICRAEAEVFGDRGEPFPWPNTPVQVRDINGTETVQGIQAMEPDLIVVSGTKLIKDPVFAIRPRLGLVNLHTGLSPYYRGGPNCTLWCLANHEPQYIGATVHLLDPGIDSGAILLSEQVVIEPDDTIAGLVWKTVEKGHELYETTLRAYADGRLPKPLPQAELGNGRTYFTREWNVVQMARAVRYVNRGKLRAWVDAGRPGFNSVRVYDPADEST